MTPSFKQKYFYVLMLVIIFLASFCIGRAFRDTDLRIGLGDQSPIVSVVGSAPAKTSGDWTVKVPTEAVEFIAGPLVADTGQLCVFRLNDPDTRADWVIVPEATCYIDSSGSSLAFASNIPAKYTIIAAVVEEGYSPKKPKILTHVCEYGLQPKPNPSPNPSPNPDPTPMPGPTPPVHNLPDWVSQNVPDAGRGQCAALAACYESAASDIENGSIRSQEAAFSAIRTATQTKIDIDIWAGFLDTLSGKITEKLGGNIDVKKLGTIFSEIAIGLKSVSDTGSPAEPEVSVPDILPFPMTNSACPDPTGKACQPQFQLRRRAM